MAGPRRLQTVAETSAFADDIDAMLPQEARDLVIAEIAVAPVGGDLISGTGGLRSVESHCPDAASAAVRE